MTTEGIISDIFGNFGEAGVLILVFLIFLIDAIIFPALPEVFFILGFNYNPTLEYGAALILMALIAELVGIFTLYYIVKKIRIPKKIADVADKYVGFLIVSDERIFLVNRFAPMIPFAGAFIAIVDTWDKKKCAAYIAIGCVIKYGVILLASNFFYSYFSGNMSLYVTIAFVLIIIAISLVASYLKKKKSGIES